MIAWRYINPILAHFHCAQKATALRLSQLADVLYASHPKEGEQRRGGLGTTRQLVPYLDWKC